MKRLLVRASVVFCFAGALWGASVAAAGPGAAQALPQAVQAAAGATLQPAGGGRLTFWGLQVYDAALWTRPDFAPARFAEQPFVLELHYLRNFSAADIARVSIEQMRRHGEFDDAQAQRWRTQLATLLPAIKRGDRLAGLHRPGQGAVFFHNGRPVGELADAQFARLFFAIWLGEATSEPALRQQLVAGRAP